MPPTTLNSEEPLFCPSVTRPPQVSRGGLDCVGEQFSPELVM